MAKRPPRSHANDTTLAVPPAQPAKPRRRPGSEEETAFTPSQEPAALDDTFAARPEPGSNPSEDDIRVRAYHRYLERGGGHGMEFDDWLEAERELKNKK